VLVPLLGRGYQNDLQYTRSEAWEVFFLNREEELCDN
jgi:hypothetical protein